MSRVYLTYSKNLLEPGTFFLLADGFTIRANIGEAESRRYVVEIPLRRSASRYEQPNALHCRPLDGELEVWLVESSIVHPELARMELVLRQVPAEVGCKLLEL